MSAIDYEDYFKRLLAMNQRGAYLVGMNGHTYIVDNDEYGGWDATLRNAGVTLNSKIYGGALEAIDTFDAAVQAAREDGLAEWWVTEIGDGGVGKNRIDIVEKGKGGIN